MASLVPAPFTFAARLRLVFLIGPSERRAAKTFSILRLRIYPHTEQIAITPRSVRMRIAVLHLHGGACGECIGVKVSPNSRSGVGASGTAVAAIQAEPE